uniref:Uncharacterized protein n=1 Tax=Cyprinus carpio carpio TaxID=630221 RepID=A0A9J7XTJ5_CYPCA
ITDLRLKLMNHTTENSSLFTQYLNLEELLGEGDPHSGHDLWLLLQYLSGSHGSDNDCAVRSDQVLP